MSGGWKEIIKRWKERDYVTYREFTECLPADIMDKKQIDDIASMINDMGIEIKVEDAKIIDINSERSDE